MNQTIEHLLHQISAINKKYEEIAEITGENFNIFNVLGVSTSEVRTHSAFLAELLNPKGSHGQKEVFLKLFCEHFKIVDFNCEKAIVSKEKYIGRISSDSTEGGFIDIIITDNNGRAIIIENKIYAGDGLNQLKRYSEYGKKYHHEMFSLLYLTLDGKQPDDWSRFDLKEEKDYKNISYNTDILLWMEICKEKAVNHPILRETLTQYIFLIRYLTGQTINNKMSQEIIEQLIKSEENVKASLEIAKNIHEMKVELFNKYAIKLKDVFNSENKNGFEFKYEPENIGKKGFALGWKKEGYDDQLLIIFDYFEVICIGIYNYNESTQRTNVNLYKQILDEMLNPIGAYQSWGKQCVYIRRYEKLKHFFRSSEGWASIAGKDFHNIEDVVETVNKMLAAIVKANNKSED